MLIASFMGTTSEPRTLLDESLDTSKDKKQAMMFCSNVGHSFETCLNHVQEGLTFTNLAIHEMQIRWPSFDSHVHTMHVIVDHHEICSHPFDLRVHVTSLDDNYWANRRTNV